MVTAKILDFYIDTRYQRQTDIRKCFKNVNNDSYLIKENFSV